MSIVHYHSSEWQTARRLAAEQLRKIGAPVRPASTGAQIARMIAERTGWGMPAATPSALLPFLQRFLVLTKAGATPPPYRPFKRDALRYDLAMRVTAARAASVQPRLIAATSNIITWREIAA